jgi:integrase
MARTRKPYAADKVRIEGERHFAYLFHPVFKKTISFALGSAAEYRKNLEALNRVYMDASLWLQPPAEMQGRLREQWMGADNVIHLHGEKVKRGTKEVSTTAAEVARLLAKLDATERLCETYLRKIELQARELETIRGKKYAAKDSPTLAQAKISFMAAYTGRDQDHTKNVEWDLDRFIQKFGERTKVDSLQGRETEINAWLRSLKTAADKPIGPSRRMQVRLYVIKLLIGAGANIDKSKIERPKKKEVRKSRGAIRWLTKEQAEQIAENLPAPYSDAFRIQVAIGLRPDEVLTLHKHHFKADFSELTLEPLGNLTLKTGSRTIPIPASLRPILRWRAQQCEVLFPEPKGRIGKKKLKTPRKLIAPAEGGKAWRNPKMFNRRFKQALENAADTSRINIKMDSRIGRRTCASLLLQNNVSAEKIAALLGNSPEMILEHYGDTDLKSLDLSTTSIVKVADLDRERIERA